MSAAARHEHEHEPDVAAIEELEQLVAEVEALGPDEPADDAPAPSAAGLAEPPRCRYRLAADEQCPHRPRVVFGFGSGRHLEREAYCMAHAIRVLRGERIIPAKSWRLDAGRRWP